MRHAASLLVLACTWLALGASASAQQADLFGWRVIPHDGDDGLIAAGHFDGDALSDLVVQTGYAEVSMLLAQGDGTFTTSSTFGVAGGMQQILVTDMNGDGRDDLVTLHNDSDDLHVRMGDGAGYVFQLIVIQMPTKSPSSVAAADMNEDGEMDLVTANHSTDDVSVLLADGPDGFLPEVSFDVGEFAPGFTTGPFGVAVGDFDEDGHLDVVTANYDYPSTVSVLLGDGTGALGPASIFKMGTTSAWAGSHVTVTDMNEDGHDDLVTGGMGTVHLGDGTGAFLPPILQPTGAPRTIVDLDGDGHLDALHVSTVLRVDIGDGTGSTTAAGVYPVGADPKALAAGDYDGDGDLDVATINEDSEDVSVLFGDGTGAFAVPPSFPLGGSPRELAIGDLDEDGRIDLVTSNNFDENLSVVFGDGAGGFLPSTEIALAGRPGWVVVQDVDGDAHLDIAVLIEITAAGPDALELYFGDGTGAFPTTSTLDVDEYVSRFAFGDLDEDGALDLVLILKNPYSFSVRLADGVGGFGPGTDTPLVMSGSNFNPHAILLVDMAGDGHLDAVISEFYDGVAILHGDGAGGFGAQLDYFGVSRDIAVADVDADGDLDLIGWGDSGELGLMLGAFGGYLAPVALPAGAGRPVLGDLEGDGDLDVVVTAPYEFACLLGDGSGGFTLHGRFLAGGYVDGVALADMDGDLRSDVIAVGRSTSGVPSHATVQASLLPSAWTNLYLPLAGSAGPPSLTASGTLEPGSPITLVIDRARPFGSATLVIGSSALLAPFKGGTLVPQPSLLVLGLPLDVEGHFEGSGTWYSGLPPGTTTWFQAWIADPAGPAGFAATNAVLGTTP